MSGRSDFPLVIDKQALQEISRKAVQLPISIHGWPQEEVKTLIILKALEEYIQEHACIPDFVVNLDE